MTTASTPTALTSSSALAKAGVPGATTPQRSGSMSATAASSALSTRASAGIQPRSATRPHPTNPIWRTDNEGCDQRAAGRLTPSPGTGTPEIAGFSTAEAVTFLRALRGLTLAGCDVVEVSPAYDGPGQQTALAAANVVWELLALRALTS